ncbi:alpha/beta fold hydrolase [Lysobacter silvisoli]|uniref:Alpha/beta hydrolase n=1 Tax=Lysobacter silvisoli TaxID=2293254 RepID=A0A371K0C3_9GAMM|nr:alpha/beta hydrolase [Lysobacter silvisoli]RDZ27287.1 alpha/beta hydrolase [Lysobacter silvisoli]
MLRSTVLTLCLAAAVLPVAHAGERRAEAKPTVVLVHGAFADASSWDLVAERLRQRGLPVVAVDNPLTSLDAAAAATRRAIAQAPGQVVLVGHSWGGTVITQAGDDPKVSALVYVAAFAPDAGESSSQQLQRYQMTPGAQKLQNQGGFLSLSQEAVATDFAQDLAPEAQAQVYAHQLPLKASALAERVDRAAWKSRPSWYVVSRQDRTLSPALQRDTARRIGAELREVDAGHVSPLAAPDEVSQAIVDASAAAPAR